MLPALLGGYLAAYPPPLLPPSTAAAPSSSARLAAAFHARLRHASRLVARRHAAGAGEAVSASAAAEGDDEDEAELQDEGFPRWEGGGGEEEDYDHDPEIGDIMGDYFDDPKKAQNRMEERIRKKRHKIVQAKTGSPNTMKVVFNKFDFSNSYIWFEFNNALLPKDATLISDALRSWHIVGRLGGCNSMNMQLSQLPLDCKRPTYDALEGANVTPTSFYNIGNLEIQDNLARVWVDIGIHEPLLLDILLNALTTISSDHVGIKQVQFGGLEFVNWNEDLKTEEVGYSVRKI
ncbi:hypothetical protein SETIT_5G201300v2 [Setaria italica]|uniref:Uncharacterized protein n=1 Tax=Setaria italica TaxID=4555 RepID=K3XKM5_SETIT|nr:uncharacterized protein LOC101761245 [Setaria italica]RCV25880.1 hypothetical protein SETIT_5G201300v2 [Setaria italica]